MKSSLYNLFNYIQTTYNLVITNDPMGIRGLSSFLNMYMLKNKNIGIDVVHLSEFKGKTIAVDFTNQLHRFIYRNPNNKTYLLEFINLIHKFQSYGIKMILVLDGKPSLEKEYVINHRKAYRDKIYKKIEELLEEETDKTAEIKYLEKKTKSIKFGTFANCKYLFDLLCVPYIQIDNLEADAVFKYLLDNNLADACYSADSDIIAYGCHTVIKDLNYRYDTIECINYNKLLTSLNITHHQFLLTCILSGTDYNNSLKNSKFETNLELIKKYGSIISVINNLHEINQTLPIEQQKYIPLRFNWQHAYDLFTNDIPDDIKTQINYYLDFHNDAYHSPTKYTKLQQYVTNEIKPLDYKNIHTYKFINIVQTTFNINIKCF